MLRACSHRLQIMTSVTHPCQQHYPLHANMNACVSYFIFSPFIIAAWCCVDERPLCFVLGLSKTGQQCDIIKCRVFSCVEYILVFLHYEVWRRRSQQNTDNTLRAGMAIIVDWCYYRHSLVDAHTYRSGHIISHWSKGSATIVGSRIGDREINVKL